MLFSVTSPSTPDPRPCHLRHTAGHRLSFPYAPQIHSSTNFSFASVFESSHLFRNVFEYITHSIHLCIDPSRKVRGRGTTLEASSVINQVGDDNGVVGGAHGEGVVEGMRKRGTLRRKIGKGRREVRTSSLRVVLDTKPLKDARGQFSSPLSSHLGS